MHVEGAVDLQLQGGGDGLHADNAAEAGKGVSEVRVHLAVLYKLLLTLQGHLTDSTGSCVQALTMGHLEKGDIYRNFQYNEASNNTKFFYQSIGKRFF